MKILVRSPNWIGDQILAYPFFRRLREKFPDAHITAASRPWVEKIQFRGCVDEVIGLHSKKSISWDLGFALPNSFSSAWFLFRNKVKKRRGYSGDFRSPLLNEVIPWKKGMGLHRADAYLHLADSEMGDFWKTHTFDPEKEWPGSTPEKPPNKPYFVLAPGATADSRRWPEDRFLKLMEKIAQDTGWEAVVVGGKNEEVLTARWKEAGIRAEWTDWAGKFDLTSQTALFKNARFTVCNESGLSHFASLLGSPVFIVCGAANPARTHPIGPGPVVIETNSIECWPCEKNECRFQESARHNACLKGISVERVWERIQREFLS